MQWYDILDPKDTELDRLASEYHIHPLHVEDCRHRNQRTKIEENDGYIFAVLKAVRAQPDGDLEMQDVDLFLGQDWVITVEEGPNSAARSLIQSVRDSKKWTRADQVFYRLCDALVDGYLPMIDRIDDVIDEIEDAVLESPTPDMLARIFHTKRTLIELRKVLVNTREVASHLYRTDHSLIQDDLMPFFRDVYDHVSRNLDLVETQRDLLTGTMDVYLSSVANRTNEVMKVLTILGTIALPVLVVSGFFGMNTKGLPLTESPNGTWIVTAIMVAATAVLLIFLRRARWF